MGEAREDLSHRMTDETYFSNFLAMPFVARIAGVIIAVAPAIALLTVLAVMVAIAVIMTPAAIVSSHRAVMASPPLAVILAAQRFDLVFHHVDELGPADALGFELVGVGVQSLLAASIGGRRGRRIRR